MGENMDPKELNALISLLDDPDEIIFKEVRVKLISLGFDVIPVLENAWEHSFNAVLQTRIENIIHTIQFQKISEDLREWARSDKQDLLDGSILITKYQYPDLDEKKIRKQLDQMKQDVWLEINDNLTALEKVKIINHIMYDVYQLSGNTTNYHAPQNSYINNVLESKKGNPISLSIIYAVIAQSLDIPVYGVNLPEHFVLAYKDLGAVPIISKSKLGDSRILFYVNAFSKGAVFSRREIDAFIKQLKLVPEPAYYDTCSNLDMIKRVIRNLIIAYEKQGMQEKKDELESLLNSISM